MNTVTVSPKYQVVIPQQIRQSMGIKPKQKLQMVMYQDSIEIIPIKPISTLRGTLKGINTDVERDADRL